MSELLRPWKIATLILGVAALIAGRFIVEAPDWDVGISLVMAGVAYVTAGWAMRVFLERKWRMWPLALLATWFGVDGCYWLYWIAVDPGALIMREANAPASLSLYLACGVLWLPRCSLNSLWRQVRDAVGTLRLGHELPPDRLARAHGATMPGGLIPAPSTQVDVVCDGGAQMRGPAPKISRHRSTGA
jgi:hypothetical protein